MKIRTFFIRIAEGLRTAKGRNILTFFIFLAISTVFWFLLALNDDVQEDYALPVSLDNFPEEVTILSGYNPTINLTVKDKGSSLMKFAWGNTPGMKLRFDDFSRLDDTTLLLTSAQLNSAVRGIFGTGATLVSIRPDSLKLTYTSQPGIKVAVNINSDIRTLPQFIYGGHPIASVDSVMLYSNSSDRYEIHHISTQPVTLANLTDTAEVEVKLDVPAGMRAVPSTLKISFPVEPLVSKQQSVPVEVINAPHGVRVVTFPSMADVTYLIPKSLYNAEPAPLKACVDYNDITDATKSLPIWLSKLPVYYKSASVHPAEAEYVIEQVE